MRNLLSCGPLTGDTIRNAKGEDLGTLKEIMIDLDEGRVGYAVVSFGGVLGMGEKLFAVPWEALRVDQQNHELILDVTKEQLERMQGFDPNHWPDFSAEDFEKRTYGYYGLTPHTGRTSGRY